MQRQASSLKEDLYTGERTRGEHSYKYIASMDGLLYVARCLCNLVAHVDVKVALRALSDSKKWHNFLSVRPHLGRTTGRPSSNPGDNQPPNLWKFNFLLFNPNQTVLTLRVIARDSGDATLSMRVEPGLPKLFYFRQGGHHPFSFLGFLNRSQTWCFSSKPASSPMCPSLQQPQQ